MGSRRYWLIVSVLAAALLGGCSPDAGEPAAVTQQGPYFSLQSYFTGEAARLQALAPTVRKTVEKNEETEERKLSIRSWENELELFVLSDINMDAWTGQYEIDSTGSKVEYRATDPELRTRRIAVYRSDDGEIEHIQIANESANMLYSAKELLDYYPDSLYIIEKHQDIRWWSSNIYKITGRIAE